MVIAYNRDMMITITSTVAPQDKDTLQQPFKERLPQGLLILCLEIAFFSEGPLSEVPLHKFCAVDQ